MGRVKHHLMEGEERVAMIDRLISCLANELVEDLISDKFRHALHQVHHFLDYSLSSMSGIDAIIDLIDDDLTKKIRELENALEDINVNFTETDLKKLKILLGDIKSDIFRIYTSIKNQSMHSAKEKVYNSEEYYKKQLNDLHEQTNILSDALEQLNRQKAAIENKSLEESENFKKKILEKQKELDISNKLISDYEEELSRKLRQENAVKEWNSKIIETFNELANYLKPIKLEHSRLNVIFWIFSILECSTILFVVVFEFILCKTMLNMEQLPKWQDYLFVTLPIPIGGALLWVFVSQANRAQRQLVVLAKYMHEIKYIEGLLVSINSLSLDIDASMKRVNMAIDRLLDNHLKISSSLRNIDENSILIEEKKDVIPYDLAIKLLKEIKGLATR